MTATTTLRGVNLLNDAGQSVADTEVDENDASGVVLGKITVDDIDHPLHPNGMHMVTVNDGRFEIRKDADGAHVAGAEEGRVPGLRRRRYRSHGEGSRPWT